MSLSNKDKELIENYIDWYGPISEGGITWKNNYVGLESILNLWNKSKTTLFKIFGEKDLILHRPYTYKYNVEGLTQEIINATGDSEYQNFLSWWNWSIKHHTTGNRFKILKENQTGLFYSKFYNIEAAFSAETLANNSYNGEDYKIEFDDGTIVKVTAGMKPMKILHKFIEKFGTPKDEEMFEKFRIWHSKLLNQKTIDGELCLSIHPLDYMTMSDNNNKWTSCMRWTDKYGHAGDPGDYRAGTVDCMNSPYILIAYLHNPKHKFTPQDNFEWNSKRWRELFIVNEGCISEIKGYPYQDEYLTNTCLMWIKELALNNLGWTYEDEEINMNEPVKYDEQRDIYIDFVKAPSMYKDIGTLKKHAGRINKKALIDKFEVKQISFHRTWPKTDTPKSMDDIIFIDIPYGGITTCMCCGEVIDPVNNKKSIMCRNCDNIIVCSCCGEPIYSDDEAYWVDDRDDGPLCYNCWESETSIDDLSEEVHMTENMTEIWLFIGYNQDKKPIWYRGKTLFVYDPNTNWYYKELFENNPKYSYDRYYVTLDMIADGCYQKVMNVFEDPDEEAIYPWNLHYDINMNPVYQEEDEIDAS